VAEHDEAKLERPVEGAAEQLAEALNRIKSSQVRLDERLDERSRLRGTSGWTNGASLCSQLGVG